MSRCGYVHMTLRDTRILYHFHLSQGILFSPPRQLKMKNNNNKEPTSFFKQWRASIGLWTTALWSSSSGFIQSLHKYLPAMLGFISQRPWASLFLLSCFPLHWHAWSHLSTISAGRVI